ncbi:Endonuclease/exonuclease/phosphatase, partial [Coprinopsis sp. MPI-PUGE-AT-0042]
RTRAHVNIATLNIRGGGSDQTSEKWQMIHNVMKTNKIGVFAIQETHLTDTKTKDLNTQFKEKMRIYNTGDIQNPNSKGVAIVIDERLAKAGQITSKKLIPGRALLTTIPWKNGATTLTFLAIYAPNKANENAEFWKELESHFKGNSPEPKPDFILGDFNLVEDALDRFPSRHDDETATNALDDFLKSVNMIDGWRTENPDAITYSWSRPTTQNPQEAAQEPNATNSKSRIDRIYTTRRIFKTTCNWSYDFHQIESDHRLEQTTFYDLSTPYLGKGRWSIPSFLLDDEDFIKVAAKLSKDAQIDIEALGDDDLRPITKSPQIRYAQLKQDIVKRAKELASKKGGTNKAKLEKLQEEYDETINEETMESTKRGRKATQIEGKINDILRKQHRDNKTKAQTKFLLENETVGKYWLNLHKSKRPRDTIYGLYDPENREGPMIHKSKDMAKLARDYHEATQT